MFGNMGLIPEPPRFMVFSMDLDQDEIFYKGLLYFVGTH